MLLHASCVAYGPNGALIRGRAGSGKSALALTLMAGGAELISDDRTCVEIRDGWPLASAPSGIAGLIEARGIGLLRATPRAAARVTVIVDLDRIETDRLPPERREDLLGRSLPVLHKVESPHFAAGLLQYLKGGKAMR